ncbi:MAG TPA: FG-GAP-like repeat-containing protein [Puia sp.]|nr:FG-GAP-like repeat-containing protein [Puia sp.]
MKRRLLILCFLLAAGFVSAQPDSAFRIVLSFRPDFIFKSSSLGGWQSIGAAKWEAKNGTMVSKPGSAGILLLDQSWQDMGMHVSFRSRGGANAGILMRLEKTVSGFKGVFISFGGEDLGAYRVALDDQGHIVDKEKLRRTGGAIRIAPPPDTNGRTTAQRRRNSTAEPDLPLKRPNTELQPGKWNQAELFIDANIVRLFLNNGFEIASVAEDSIGSYGPPALYTDGAGEVEFKDLYFKDLAIRITPQEKTGNRFRMQRISDMYYSWSAAAADFNRDGALDVVSGPYIYYGPDFTRSRELYPAQALNPSKEFAFSNCQYTYDFNGDGWPDILAGPPRAAIFINPGKASRRWEKHEVLTTNVQSEISLFTDVDGDGKPELVYSGEGTVRYAKPDPGNPTGLWQVYTVSEKAYGSAHGIGVGDINGDGRKDILNMYGWWEQPADKKDTGLWVYHPQAFGRYGRGIAGGSVMGVYDVNGDGLNDVVTALDAHGWGLAWYEQRRGANGSIGFIEHIFSDDYATKNAGDVVFSQPHAAAFADIDGDGITDFVVGKRYWSHLDDYFDGDPYGAPVLYWYRTVRDPKAPGGARFVPELIHNRSGAGADLLTVDLDKDGSVDIISPTDRGTFIFYNKTKGRKPGSSSSKK